MHRLFIVIFVFVFLATGCAGLGPATVERDRFNYSASVGESWKRMMLLNIVKTRYGDTPIFLEVSSIVNQYSREQKFNASVGATSGDLLGDGLELGGSGTYYDRPTITYSPLTGEKFAKSLLTPIPPYAVFTLIQSGWNVDFIFRVCLTAINDLYNTSRRQQIARSADEGFSELLSTLATIQQQGGLGSRLVKRRGTETVVFFRRSMDEEFSQNLTQVLQLLQLRDDEELEFRLVYGSSQADDSEIAMLTRSMLDIIGELAYYIEVPEEHLRENRASQDSWRTESAETAHGEPFIIQSSKEKPEDAFIAIEYRDNWFFIEDTDFESKRVFSFLLFLFTLAESGPKGLAPVLTIPAG